VNNKRPPIIDYEGSDYQKVFWEKGGREYEDQAEEVALHRLLPKSGQLLLELGAGAGRNTPRYHGFERVVLLDYSLTQLQKAQERLGNSSRYIYVAADVYQLPFVQGAFDCATMIRTLHHMAEAPRSLRQIRGVIDSGGIFILEYANKHNYKAILRYIMGRQSWSPFTLEPVEIVKLNFDFHPKAVRAWLGSNGFRIDRQLTVSHFRIGWVKRWLPTRLLVAMDSIAQLSGDLWQLTPSVFVRSTAVGDTPIPAPDELFRCTICGHSPLGETPDYITCHACGRQWAVREGIYDFRQPIELPK
jgi:SAM-dependent methyltransferase